MKRQRKPITPEMIRKYFGQDARITSFMGRYRVRTADGGEVKISQSNINPLYGGSDVHRAVTLLGNEAWGGIRVNGGPAEFKLAMLAHGETEGVKTQIGPRGAFGRGLVATLIVIIGSNVMDASYGPVLSGVLALIVWLLMRRGAKQQAQHEAEKLGFAFPRVGSTPRAASRDDAKREGWL
jgi:hypothetical protein